MQGQSKPNIGEFNAAQHGEQYLIAAQAAVDWAPEITAYLNDHGGTFAAVAIDSTTLTEGQQ